MSLTDIQAALATLSPEELNTLREGIDQLRQEPPARAEGHVWRDIEPFYQNRKLKDGSRKRYGPYWYEVEYTYRKGKRPLKKKVKYLGKQD